MHRLDKFKIKVTSTVMEDLIDRVKRTRWPDDVENAQWNL